MHLPFGAPSRDHVEKCYNQRQTRSGVQYTERYTATLSAKIFVKGLTADSKSLI